MGANIHDIAIVILICEVQMITDSRGLSETKSGVIHEEAFFEKLTTARCLIDESTAVAHSSVNVLSFVLVRRGYLIRYSK